MLAGPKDPPKGVLDFPRALQAFRLNRQPPHPSLIPWIENYWEVEWELPPGTTHRQTNLSHAALNVAVEPDGNWLYGIPGPTFVRELSGNGRVFGVKFQPGGFYPWYQHPLKDLFDTRVPLTSLWSDAEDWAARVKEEPLFEQRAAVADSFLLNRVPALPGEGRRCAAKLIEDRRLIRVEDACGILGHDIRALQRLFHKEVGLAPKDLLRRYRLMEAAERLAQEPELSGLELALSLGYADQAHFIRDFKAVTGVPPEAYRRRQNP